ncbi:hypothetical protein SSX86_029514 [Deinandra increscens subsp. villosa]|uniref:Uncharacterized protein n=1 Tax=Deinandra increscens subsp. villosa TaxID=3103831 RepID=A0AAP0CGJ8_9ASTR
MTMDPSKVEAITKWLRPTTFIEVRSFLDLAGYYQRFVEEFSILALPLTQLMRKGVRFVWNDEIERSFEEMKKRLVFDPILTLPTSSFRISVRFSSSNLTTTIRRFDRAAFPFGRRCHCSLKTDGAGAIKSSEEARKKKNGNGGFFVVRKGDIIGVYTNLIDRPERGGAPPVV